MITKIHTAELRLDKNDGEKSKSFQEVNNTLRNWENVFFIQSREEENKVHLKLKIKPGKIANSGVDL